MGDKVKCPECGSTKFVLPTMKTGHMIIDTEDMGYRESDGEEGECVLTGGDFICASCEFIVERYTLTYAKLKEFFDYGL